PRLPRGGIHHRPGPGGRWRGDGVRGKSEVGSRKAEVKGAEWRRGGLTSRAGGLKIGFDSEEETMRRKIPRTLFILPLSVVLFPLPAGADDGALPRRLGEVIERSWRGRPEWGDMAVSLLKGEGLDGEKGWWRSGGKRRGWEWLRSRFDSDSNGRIGREELPAGGGCFERLDLDGD